MHGQGRALQALSPPAHTPTTNKNPQDTPAANSVAAALTLNLIEQGVRTRWMSPTALVQHLQQAKRSLELMGAMTRLNEYRVLVIDDIGYVRKSDSETQMLFEFIDRR